MKTEKEIKSECKFKNGSIHELETLFRTKIYELEERIKQLEDKE
jgi:hypothetical protein